ncbi:MAG: 4-hydroxy-3-methylbut-2-enyl diphosphate reductase [Bacteroidales bacterium]|nr:4-hydroxy-3-methylbut-2-enyl diphosphate reductase [Bacteroidales bacterium]
MNLQVEIDRGSGFCNGVIRAVETAERNLDQIAGSAGQNNTAGQLYSLGAIVHNNAELERLHKKGLTVIDIGEMKQMRNTTVLIRAHGEPPCTYAIAKENGIKLIDCTCPVVLKLQERIRETYKSVGGEDREGEKGQIVIFGKEGHAEVNGLVGQVNSDAVITDVIHSNDGCSIKGLSEIDFTRPVYIFSQTTKDPQEYKLVCRRIQESIASARGCSFEQAGEFIKIHDTICRQVAQRHSNLVQFAKSKSVIIFVSGRESSNGKVLYDLCRGANGHSYHIQGVGQIEREWFADGDSVGICGATSTPKWQLEEVAEFLRNL